MLLAANGVFVEYRNPWLYARLSVGMMAPGLRLPYGDATTCVRLAFGTIPRDLLDAFVAVARRAMPNEVAGGLIFDPRSGGLRLSIHDSLDASPASVRYRAQSLEAHELLAVDLHSHGRLPPCWSTVDDADDQGVRICGVFGNLDRDEPTARLRLAFNGIFLDLPSPWQEA